MVELRYLGSPHFLRLQYRYITPNVDASGALCPPGEWSEWKDVSVSVPDAEQGGRLTQPDTRSRP